MAPAVQHVLCLDQFLAQSGDPGPVRGTALLPLTKEVPITEAKAAMTFDWTNPQDRQALAALDIHLTPDERQRLLNPAGVCEPDRGRAHHVTAQAWPPPC